MMVLKVGIFFLKIFVYFPQFFPSLVKRHSTLVVQRFGMPLYPSIEELTDGKKKRKI